MTAEIVAACGLACDQCEAYKATQANDMAWVERVAAQWRVEYNSPSIVAESVVCDGCLSEGRKCSNCGECDIRACVVERGVANCAHCADYGCDKVAGLLQAVPDAKARLDAIRATLGRA
jgi:hypothetical protein